MTGDFGTSPSSRGQSPDELTAYLSTIDAANSKDCCRPSNAVAPLQAQQLDHQPQQADEMRQDLSVCRVFKGLVVNDREPARGPGLHPELLETAVR